MQNLVKLVFGTVVVLVCMLMALPAAAGPMDDARAAYAKGEYTLAYTLLKPLAEGGDQRAQFNLGLLYELGRGVPQSYSQAIAWYKKSAYSDFARAQHNLGSMYCLGRGTEQSDYEALNWYRKAAAQNYTDAQLNLGAMYENGRGIRQSFETARSWYEKAQAAGSTLQLRVTSIIHHGATTLATAWSNVLIINTKYTRITRN